MTARTGILDPILTGSIAPGSIAMVPATDVAVRADDDVMRRRVLITGSRTWVDRAVIRAALASVWSPQTILVSGACPTGADALCEACWRHWKGRVERHPANWGRFGRSAGFRRNTEMVDIGAAVCLAFIRDASPGATHTADLARRAGIPTRVFRSWTGSHPTAIAA